MRLFIATLFIIATADCTNAKENITFVGPPKYSTRIVGGYDAEPCELSYHVSLQDVENHPDIIMCGGSIIDENWILTAAHCVKNYIRYPQYLKVATGEYEVFVNEGTEQTFKVSKIYVHEEYNKDTFSNDIALLQLSTPIRFDDCSQPVPLPKTNLSASGICSISGWGLVLENGIPSNTLQKASVPIVSEEECKQAQGYGNIDNSMICAGFEIGGTDTCQGDSGGPLVCNDAGAIYVAGVASWGIGCAREGYPGVYSDASKFIEWIGNHMENGVDSVSFAPVLFFLLFILI